MGPRSLVPDPARRHAGVVRPPADITDRPDRDISDVEDVALLVRRFYQAAIPDPLLGHLFEVGGIEWDVHIPLITSFWARELLGEPGYAGNVARAHVPVMADPAFDDVALARWLELFGETVDEEFAGPVAERAKERAHQAAGALRILARRVQAGKHGDDPTLLGPAPTRHVA